MTGRVLVDAAAHLTWGITSKHDNMESNEHAGGVLELVIDGILISLEGIERRNSHPRAQVFSALGPPFLYTVPDLPGTRSNEWAVG